jgi:hypothetical protein
VAGTSDVSADHHLYVPIAGPWLDLGDRPGCGSGHIGCDTETTYKVLLVVDGLFQGIGALTTVAGFLSPERHELVSTADAGKPTLHVAPASVASGYGLAAFGRFCSDPPAGRGPQLSTFRRESCCLAAVATAPVTFLLLASALSSCSRRCVMSFAEKAKGVRGFETRFSLTW